MSLVDFFLGAGAGLDIKGDCGHMVFLYWGQGIGYTIGALSPREKSGTDSVSRREADKN